MLAVQQVGVADLVCRGTACVDDADGDGQVGGVGLEVLGGALDEPGAGLGGGLTHRGGVDLDRGAGDGGALIGGGGGAAHEDAYLRCVDIEFFGGDLGESGAQAGA